LGRERANPGQVEVAWPALIAALRRAEAADFDPAELLAALASPRAIRTAGSMSEAVAVRINRYLATHPDPASTTGRAETPLPWMTPPPTGFSAAMTQYLHDARELITARVAELADVAVRHRPPWMQPLGQPPADRDRDLNRQWQAHVATIAAYREQSNITTDDPAHILGRRAEPGTPARKPYWHAAESVLAARRLTGLDAPTTAASPDAQARAQTGSDIYRALPERDRAEISTEMAGNLGLLWFRSPTTPDEEAASPPIHATTLARTLSRHGYLMADLPPAPEPPSPGDLLGARAARRGPIRGSHRVPAPSGPVEVRLQVQSPRRPDAATCQGPQPRVM
jgi:hypothetical protein